MNFDPYIVLLIGLVLFLLINEFVKDVRVFGQTVACKNGAYLVPFVLIISIYFCFSYIVLRNFLLDIYTFFISSLSAVMLVWTTFPILSSISAALTYYWRKHKAGALLLDLGKIPGSGIISIFFSIVGFAFVALYGSAFLALLPSANQEIRVLISGVAPSLFWGSFGFTNLLLAFSRIEIREQGICCRFFALKWKAIESYRWSRTTDNTLHIQHKAMWTIFRSIWLQIPSTKENAVAQLLSQHLLMTTR